MKATIIHAFPRLMSLYGDYANAAVLKRRLELAGVECETIRVDSAKELGSYPCENSLLFIGAGTELSAARVCGDCFEGRAEIKRFLDGGGYALACGVAGAALGEGIQIDGALRRGAGVADMRFVFKRGVRRYGEVLARFEGAADETVGVINTSCDVNAGGSPMFSVEYSSLGSVGPSEGFSDGRVFCSELTGPLLVRNPALLEYFASLLAGRELGPADDPLFGYMKSGYLSVLGTIKAAAAKDGRPRA